MATNDPKDPTTWTPEMVRAFNAYRAPRSRNCVPESDPERLALEAVARAAEAFEDCVVMADDGEPRGWYMLMVGPGGGPPAAEHAALRSALAALREARR